MKRQLLFLSAGCRAIFKAPVQPVTMTGPIKKEKLNLPLKTGATAGFTLIEVLVATMILFSALVVGSQIFRQAFSQDRRIAAAISFAASLPEITDRIALALAEGKKQGQGEITARLTFTWRAKVAKKDKNVISSANEFGAGTADGSFFMLLYEVSLEISAMDRSGALERQTDYTYYELGWKEVGVRGLGS